MRSAKNLPGMRKKSTKKSRHLPIRHGHLRGWGLWTRSSLRRWGERRSGIWPSSMCRTWPTQHGHLRPGGSWTRSSLQDWEGRRINGWANSMCMSLPARHGHLRRWGSWTRSCLEHGGGSRSGGWPSSMHRTSQSTIDVPSPAGPSEPKAKTKSQISPQQPPTQELVSHGWQCQDGCWMKKYQGTCRSPHRLQTTMRRQRRIDYCTMVDSTGTIHA